MNADSVHSQPVGNCELGEAEAILDGNNVRAKLFNTGGLFWKGGYPLYEVPAGTGRHSMFVLSTWVAGFVGGDLRFAGASYGGWEFWPGPLDEDGNPPPNCTEYDRIWKVSLEDVARYNTTGETTSDLVDWPIELGAPVLDGDGIDGNYNLAAGDRPALTGNETAFWVMNDRGNEHLWGETDPIGLTIRATAFAFSEEYAHDRLGDSVPLANRVPIALDHTTFYRYELEYHGQTTLDSTFVGLFADPDLGCFLDDYHGSMPGLGAGYVYNGNEYDGCGEGGYGEAPPAVAVAFLDGPGPSRMHAFVRYINNSNPVNGTPGDGADAYRYMNGLWRNGEPITFGDNGYGGDGPPTRYMFPDLPPSFWSEENTNGQGAQNNPSQRRFMMSHGPFQLQPGGTAEVYFAVIWTRGINRHASVAHLLTDIPAAGFAPLEPDPRLRTFTLEDLETFPPIEETFPDFYRFSATPNPAEGPISIQYELPETAAVRIALYDVLGRELRVVAEVERAAGAYTTQLDGSGLPTGTYLLHVQFGNLSATKPITIFR